VDSGRDYAGAIALAIGDAGARGDFGRAAALAGLMSAIKLPAGHNPDIELGPWFAEIEKATRTVIPILRLSDRRRPSRGVRWT